MKFSDKVEDISKNIDRLNRTFEIIEDDYYEPGSFCIISFRYGIITDDGIAKFFNMTRDEYKTLMINEFNGRKHFNGDTCFDRREDAEQAISYFDSILLMKELSDV